MQTDLLTIDGIVPVGHGIDDCFKSGSMGKPIFYGAVKIEDLAKSQELKYAFQKPISFQSNLSAQTDDDLQKSLGYCCEAQLIWLLIIFRTLLPPAMGFQP